MLKDVVRSAGRSRGGGYLPGKPGSFSLEPHGPRLLPRRAVRALVAGPGAARPSSRAVLARSHAAYDSFLTELEARADLLHSVPHDAPVTGGATPHWNNTWFTALDGAALMTMLAWKRPSRFFRDRLGLLDLLRAHAIDTLNLPTRITSIDPMPRREIDALCDWTVRSPLESCDLKIFEELKAGDILFFDGSHRSFANSDVTVVLLRGDAAPRTGRDRADPRHLIPDDYPSPGTADCTTSRYLLAAMLPVRARRRSG